MIPKESLMNNTKELNAEITVCKCGIVLFRAIDIYPKGFVKKTDIKNYFTFECQTCQETVGFQ